MTEKELYLLGIEQMRSGKYEAAYRKFTEAIEKYPNNADFYSERGVVLFHMENLQAALEDMNKAQELEPNKPYRYSSRAFIKDALKDVHGAIADYKKAIELDPEDEVAHNNLGLLEEKLGYADMAKMRFSKADQLAEEKANSTSSAMEIDAEGEKLINSFKEELKLTVVEDSMSENEENPNQTSEESSSDSKNIAQTAASVFYSKNAFKDYLKFLKKLLRL